MDERLNAGEYEAARTGAVVIDRDDRALLRMHGRDPLKMIQGLVTNDVAGAAPGQGVYAALLTPKGKLLADLRVFRRDGDILIETAMAALENVTSTFKKFVPPLFARYEAVQGSGVLGVYGPRAGALLAELLGEPLPGGVPEEAFVARILDGDELLVVNTRYTGNDGWDVMGASAALGKLRERLIHAGAQAVDDTLLDVLRIEAGRPRWGAELDENVLPLEARIEDRAISTSKGCYTGQEIVIRIMHRGHVNWLLRGVLLGDSPLPVRDTALLHPSDFRKIGRITSACFSPRLGALIALAYVRRELEPPVEVKLERPDGADVVIVDLPFPSTTLGEPAASDAGA